MAKHLKDMHIVIYGTGAIGGFYGAHLLAASSKTGVKLSFLARGKNYEALKANGLTLTSHKGESNESQNNYQVDVYDNYSQIDKPDLVLLCVKSRDTKAAAEVIASNMGSQTYVVSIQNGVENELRLSELLGKERVMACLTNIAAQNTEPGIYTQAGKYDLILGEMDGSKSERLAALTKLMQDSDVNVKNSESIIKDMWTKLIWNAAYNPISALHELEIGQLMASQDYRQTILGIMEETKNVAEAQGIKLDEGVVQYQFNRTAVPAWANFKTSMFQDILQKRPIEIEELLGIVIRKGKEYNVETPYAESIYKPLEQKVSSMGL